MQRLRGEHRSSKAATLQPPPSSGRGRAPEVVAGTSCGSSAETSSRSRSFRSSASCTACSSGTAQRQHNSAVTQGMVAIRSGALPDSMHAANAMHASAPCLYHTGTRAGKRPQPTRQSSGLPSPLNPPTHVLDKDVVEPRLVQLRQALHDLAAVACGQRRVPCAKGRVQCRAGRGQQGRQPRRRQQMTTNICMVWAGHQEGAASAGRRQSPRHAPPHPPESKYSRTMSIAAALKACTLGWKGEEEMPPLPPLPLASGAPGVPGMPAAGGTGKRVGGREG